MNYYPSKTTLKNSFPYNRTSIFPEFSYQWGTRGPLALLPARSWLGAWETPQPPCTAPSPALPCRAAETLQVSHVSRDIPMCVVLSGCEMEVRNQWVEERVYAGAAALMPVPSPKPSCSATSPSNTCPKPVPSPPAAPTSSVSFSRSDDQTVLEWVHHCLQRLSAQHVAALRGQHAPLPRR